MYRRGPSKSTPANVQCQKCLKRDKLSISISLLDLTLTILARHYSYECKATTQERPYIARPSRTQQLLNPKLVPKLASDSTDAQPDTKGLADQVLAEREAERTRERKFEQGDDEDNTALNRPRSRSQSYDSVSSISTRGHSSPPGRRVSVSPDRPVRAARGSLPTGRRSRRQSFDSVSDNEGRYSPSPQRRTNRDTKSPTPSRSRTRSLSYNSRPQSRRFDEEDKLTDRQNLDKRQRRVSESPSQSPQPENRRRFRSRSPRGPWEPDNASPRRDDRPTGSNYRGGRERRGGMNNRGARERSLSPFSKRLALTQSMNSDRR